MQELWRELISKLKLPRVLTIIGGGGKTSLMYYLLKVLHEANYQAVGTSTTKLSSKYCNGECFVEVKSISAACHALKAACGKHDTTLVYGQDPSNAEKTLGISSEWIDELAKLYAETVFVVEGDGSAGKSLKGHLAHEPVIPKLSSLVIVVVGIDSIGVNFNRQNVHRPERINELLGNCPDDIVTPDAITKLLFHPQGYLHNCPVESEIIIFINKVEVARDEELAEKLAQQIFAYQHPKISKIMIGSVQKGAGRWLQA